MSTPADDLIPVFIPALGVVLVVAEDRKGAPLSDEEVIRVRDRATCVMMVSAEAAKLVESRGVDIDPENCWYDWQMLRRELGRLPELDPGPMFRQIPSSDPDYLRTIADARAGLSVFRAMLPADGSPHSGSSGEGLSHGDAIVKTTLTEGDRRAFMWLMAARRHGDAFVGEVFEAPQQLPSFQVGDLIEVTEETLLDWSVNVSGTLHGGYSLRYQRARLPEAERAAYDEYIGVTKYA